MDYRMRKRILTLLIACALLLVCSVQCLAEQIAVYTANDNAKVYDAAGNVIGALPADTALTLTGVKGNVCRVEKSGKTAYMLKADLKQAEAATPQTEAQASAKTATAYVAKDGAKVYNANGKAAGSLSLNAQVTVTAVKGDACKISVNGKTGYMKKADLSAEKVSDAADAETASRTAYAGKDGAQVVDKRGEVIATLSLNAEVIVTAVKGSVSQVRVNGKTGYMLSSDLSCDKTEKREENSVVEIKATPGYVSAKNAKVYDATGKEIGTLSLNAAVSVTAYNDNLVQIATGTTKGYMKKSEISDTPLETTNSGYTNGANKSNGPVGGSTVAPAKGTAQAMDWWTSGIQKIFARGTVAQITDVETGISWREKRFGGINHADCQPLTAADTAALKYVYGGVWSWDRRAIFVTIDGVNYAASMNGMPHGGQSITDNDFEGHHCIHFTNSRLHVNNKVDSKHQAAIKKAAAATLE
ncbi:MAG: hypothetical protein IJ769_03995 [Clostridia bacterium]|nr:hypothetical protein [Clostridia bacterium]